MKAVIFDMDGVLFDSERLFLECWKEIGRKYHLRNVEKASIEATGTNDAKTKEIFLSICGSNFPYDDVVEEVRNEFHQKPLPVKKGARELLHFLKIHHIPISLASSTIRSIVEKELKEADLYQYFNAIVTGDMVTKSKPEPDIFLLAAKQLHVQKEDCFVIEDSFNGILAASKANMKGIMVPDLRQPDSSIRSLALTVMNDLLEVKEYFAKEFHIDNPISH